MRLRGSPSVVARLIWALVGSLTVVAVIVGAGGAWLINGIAESTSDRILGASARAIAETIAIENGEITLDIPPYTLGMLENNERDNIYYSVRRNGQVITGYADMPSNPPAPGEQPTTSYRYDTYRGANVRVAAEARRLPQIDGSAVVTVEVAETLEARRELARRMLLGLAALEAMLVGVAGVLVWPATRWSLRPITRLQRVIEMRNADFTPLPVAEAPTELAGLVTDFNSLLARLDASVEGVRRFTADASHQMRTPLAILRTHLSLLKKHGTQSEIGRQSLADIQLATDRLQSLLTGLVALARAEEDDLGTSRTKTDVRTVIRDVWEVMRPLAEASGVRLDIQAPARPVTVMTDALLLDQLLSNLVDNAIRYNNPGGSVRLSLTSNDGAPLISVHDDGPGIPAEDRERVFSRFYRMARDQRQPGSGLGLSIVNVIAQRLGASLELTTGRGGQGLTVTVILTPGDREVV